MRGAFVGGAMSAAALGSTLLAQTPTGSVRGVVFDSLVTGRPLTGAVVELFELARHGVTDARGVFRIDSIPAGRYTLTFTHPSLLAVGFTPPDHAFDLGPGVDFSIALATPAPATVYRRLCPPTAEAKVGVLLGTVKEAATDSALAGAVVRADWTETLLARGTGITRHPKVARTATDRDGRYQLCGVPTDVPVLLRLVAGGVEGPPLELIMNERAVGVRQLTIDLSDSTRQFRGRVTGKVTSGGAPVAQAQVALLGGTQTARTDGDGAFVLDRLPTGTHTIEARAIGYLRQRRDVQLRPDQPLTVDLALNRAAVELPELTVRAERASAGWTGFERRRQLGLGSVFMPRADITRRRSIYVQDLFKGVAGIRVETIGANDYQIFSLRGGAGLSTACAPTIYVDGIRIPSDPESGNGLPVTPEEVDGIEIHQSISSAPFEYQASGQNCGVILIWTRRGR